MATQPATPRTGKPRGSYAKSAQTRQTILDAALDVFSQAGYHSGSLREVAERVGMSEAGLLHHFKNKSSLLEAVLERRDQLSYDIVPLDQMDGEASLRGLVALARRNATTPGVVELFSKLAAEATSPEHPAHAYFQNRYAWTRENLELSFANLAGRGVLRAGVTPAGATLSTVAMMDGLQIQWLLDPNLLDMGDELAQHFRQLTTLDF